MKDFYYILGTNSKATGSELNAAYRKLSQKLQTGTQDDDGFIESHFQEITQAYQTLSNPIARRRYDAALRKAHRNRFYFFKIKYINIAVTLALVTLTALFGYYVNLSLKHTALKKADAQLTTVAATNIKHVKKKHYLKNRFVAVNKKYAIHKDTLIHHTVVASVPARLVQAPITPAPPVIQKQDEPISYATNTTAEIRANATGLVYLHETANYRSSVLASIPDHAKVQLLEKGTGFYKINYQGQMGYVPQWALALQ